MTARTRLLGVDYGSVRIGLAVSDPDRKIAFPLATYTRRSPKHDEGYFRELTEAEEIGEIIVGLPVHLDGHEGSKATEARGFGAWLGKVTGLPVRFWDERFTTVEAEEQLWSAGLTHKRRKARRDRVAAQILLQSYLDAGCPAGTTAGGLNLPVHRAVEREHVTAETLNRIARLTMKTWLHEFLAALAVVSCGLGAVVADGGGLDSSDATGTLPANALSCRGSNGSQLSELFMQLLELAHDTAWPPMLRRRGPAKSPARPSRVTQHMVTWFEPCPFSGLVHVQVTLGERGALAP